MTTYYSSLKWWSSLKPHPARSLDVLILGWVQPWTVMLFPGEF